MTKKYFTHLCISCKVGDIFKLKVVCHGGMVNTSGIIKSFQVTKWSLMFLVTFEFWYKKLFYKVKPGFLFKCEGAIVGKGMRHSDIDTFCHTVCLTLSDPELFSWMNETV